MAESKETIRDRLRNLLSLNKSSVSRVSSAASKQSLLSHEFWLDIGASSLLELRLEKLKDAMKLVETDLLEDSVTKKLWVETKDLLQSKMAHEIRVMELSFVRSIIKGQYRRLGILRAVFFQALQEHTIPEDAAAVVQTFEALSDNGKDIELFEHEVGPLLVDWMPRMKGNLTLISLLVNIIKFNSAYLDQDIMKILSHICALCNTKSPEEEKELALQVVEAVICYSSLPHESLYTVTVTLCRVLNLKKFCNRSWELMRKLLGTHLGHSCICTMCDILQNPKMLPDWPILRSSVFFIGMGLWGSVRVKTLKHTPQSVLPSFLCSLQTKNVELAFEVTLTMQRLVRKFGHELRAVAWDHVLDIVSALLELVEECSSQRQLPAAISLKTGVHELITFIEKLYESEVYDGSVNRLFNLTERCSLDRSDDSVFLLITFKAQSINPTKQNWISNLLLLMSTFYTRESRTSVRLRTLKVLWSVIESSMNLYEEELVTEVMMSCFSELNTEYDLLVKTKAVETLVQSCLVSNDFCLDLLGLLRKILDHGWRDKARPVEGTGAVDSYADIEELVLGLVRIFKKKFLSYPGAHSAETFQLSCSFLQKFYSSDTAGANDQALVQSRKEAFDLLLSLRANSKGQLALKKEEVAPTDDSYAVYLLASSDNTSTDEKPDGVGYINCGDIMGCVLLCLKQETCWPVLETVLKRLCGLLQNKAIVVGCKPETSGRPTARSAQLDDLAKTLCSMMSDSDLARRKLTGSTVEVAKADVQASILFVLSCMVSYHRWLEVSRQRHILRCLESGFTSRCARQCIGALTLSLAEMPRDTLLRVLPSVLLRLSQMSATVTMATAVLELLATLAQLPQLYSNFVEDQYMSVFVVALQYTNPSKFSSYVVSLAHYIIGTWFAKCRMSFRPDFVRLITKHLHAANRRGTHTEDGSAVDVIRNDLMETCIDMMARYTFSNCSTPPRRSALAQFLFDGGPSCTWLVGNKLITITTSDVTISPENISSAQAPIPPSTPSSMFWPKPTNKYFDRNLSSEAPGKLQTDSFSSPTSSPRQRHRSGSALMRRSLHLSPFEVHNTKTGSVRESTKQRLNFHDGAFTEPKSTQLKCLTEGWAEIYIRRPSGNTAWSMRIQNRLESAEKTNLEDVLSLRSFLKEIEERNKPQREEPLVEEVPQEAEEESIQEQAEDELPSNDYMDLTTFRRAKPQVDSQKQEASEPPQKPTTLDFGPPTLPQHAQTPPPTQHPPSLVRQRSHTVSTSKDCVVEAAAMSAKRAAELKRSKILAEKDSTGVDPKPTITVSAERPETSEPSQQHRQSGISSPCFVFLQLFQSAVCTESIHRPVLLPVTPGVERGIQVLDRIPPYDTWATGVVYVGPGQGADGTAILANECGSPRYQEFLHGLGDLICLTDCDPSSTFLSGLDTSGEDGNFTYVWKEDVSQMVFDVTTLMPNKSSDAGCKKRHIGNDYVMIAYDDDNGRYVPGCVVQGQFRSAEVVITPLDHSTNHVRYVFHRECVKKSIGTSAGPWLVSDQSLSIFVRQLALHANMAAFVCLGEGKGAGGYTSRALARLKQIKRIRARAVQEEKRDGPTLSRHTRGEQATKDSDAMSECHRLEEFSDYVV